METLWRDEPCGSVYQGFGSRPKKQARSMWIFNLDKRMVPTSSSPGQRGCVTKAEFHRVPKLLPFIAKTSSGCFWGFWWLHGKVTKNKIPMQNCKTFLLPIIVLFRVTFPHTRLTPANVSWDNAQNITSKGSGQISSDYAYAWILGGIHEDKPSYKGFVWTILISANILRREGSAADFWVYARLSPNSTLEELSDEDSRLFRALDVNVILLEKPKKESFAQVVYDKFLTINMTDYKRVMFLDGDMMPTINLDYIFHLSDPYYESAPNLLKPNLIVATRGEPCNTGMFMVEPSQQNFEKYLDVVRRQHQSAKTLQYPHFDWDKGWGHSFKEVGDFWESVNIKGKQQWRWHASHSDQGLMYMYAKYVIGEVSIAIGDRVQNWRRGRDERLPVKEADVRELFIPFQGELLQYQHSCDNVNRRQQNRFWRCNPPYDSTAHFMGKEKPWLGQHVRDEKATYGQHGAKGQWFAELEKINDKLNMSIDIVHWNSKIAPQMKDVMLGEMAMFKDQEDVLGTV